MVKQYSNEFEGQIDFYQSYLKVVNSHLSIADLVADNNDGVLNGNLLEFKLNISDLNSVLFQAIKYLSARRIKGKPVPENIILISLNNSTAYCYKSEKYLAEIENVYIGGASKSNQGFQSDSPFALLNYNVNPKDENILIKILRTNGFTKIHIDENDIVGWASNYYRINPNARKSDFIGDQTGRVKIIGEIRKPNLFKDYILPYNGETNVKFQYLMDKLNDDILKKNLGAFYTPTIYAKKSIELLREAILRVPEGNDYIILDRCAGTGNLEKGLSNEELSHVILSTVEYYEYKVMLELLGDKVRYIIPPTEKEDTFNMGLVRGADALSKDYIENEVISQYLLDQRTTVILFENPPYAETTSIEHQKKKRAVNSSGWKNSYVVTNMKMEVKGAVANDLGNAFIWSAFKYYLRQPTDSYVLYSPVKYWKAQHLIDRRFIRGYAFNRKHFHTNINACIMVALWSFERDKQLSSFNIEAFDVIDGQINQEGQLPVKKVKSIFSAKYYDKRVFKNDTDSGILVGLNGLEVGNNIKRRIRPIYNENIVGYLVADSSGFDNPDLHSSLLIAGRYNGNGFYLRSDNYKEKLPLFASSRYINYRRNWTERARIMKSADGSDQYFHDCQSGKLNQFLLKVLLFSIFEPQNHMRSFVGSNNVVYRNELCLDDTNGVTIAIRDLKELQMNDVEKRIIKQWESILDCAKKTKDYNSSTTYGMFQINDELNSFQIVADGKKNRRVYDYPELNGNIATMKSQIKEYYLNEIVSVLFKYEFLK